jgi:hypothetical protein
MRLLDIQRQTTWCKQVEVTVRSVGIAYQNPENGSWEQVIEITGSDGREDVLRYYYNDEMGKVEFTETGTQFYDIKWMGDWFKARPAKAPPKETLNATANKPTDWDAVNLGKCRHGILCAYIQNEGLPRQDVGGLADLKYINKLAHFSMTGEIE